MNIENNQEQLILKKKKIIDIVKNLSKLEYFEIFEILKKDNCSYSENKNGIFINLNNVNEDTIDKIFNFINFIKHKKEELIKHEEVINNAKKNINNNTKTIEIKIENLKEEEIEENIFEDNNYQNENNNSNYLFFSSDEDEDIENKIILKKKNIIKKTKIIKNKNVKQQGISNDAYY
jgi:hypothetical protein